MKYDTYDGPLIENRIILIIMHYLSINKPSYPSTDEVVFASQTA